MKYLYTLSLLFISVCLHAQRFTVSGTIEDKKNGEELIGASVYVDELKTGTATNAYGFYSITVKPGKYTLVVTYVGYEAQRLTIDLTDANRVVNERVCSSISCRVQHIVMLYCYPWRFINELFLACLPRIIGVVHEVT